MGRRKSAVFRNRRAIEAETRTAASQPSSEN
jgi:hypothetical protein